METKTEAREYHAKIDGLTKSIHDLVKRGDNDKEQLEKMGADSSEALVKLNQLEAQEKSRLEAAKGVEERLDTVEKELYRTGSNSASSSEAKGYYTEEEFKAIDNYMRGDSVLQQSAMPKLSAINKKNLENVIRSQKCFKDLPTEKMNHLVKTWVEGSDPQGGFLVRDQYWNIVGTRDDLIGTIQPFITTLPMISDKAKFILDDDIAARSVPVGEGCHQRVDSTEEIAEVTVEAKSFDRNVKATRQFLEDASVVDPERMIARKLGQAFDRQTNDSIINGTGALDFKGLLNYDEWASGNTVYTRDALQRIDIANGAAQLGGIDYADIVNLSMSVPTSYMNNMRWVMSRDTWAKILLIIGSDGQPILKPQGGVGQGFAMQLMGAPVTLLDQMPSLAASAEPIILGDFSTVVKGDRLGMRIQRNPYRETGCVLYEGFMRAGLAMRSFDGLKIGKVL